jgi:nondiscriminating glutamyl-tRNA synthetase
MTTNNMREFSTPPRVRIAPSPTGKLHIGTARTALFNWLFARRYGGIFVLRIEDTDLERSSPEYERDIIDNLKWLGISYDEGPDIGGPYGPYRQSEKIEHYARYIKFLLERKLAYYCFCSEEELEATRQAMLAKGMAPKYSGKCRALSFEEATRRVLAGESCIVRLVMPEKKVEVNDLIRGKLEFDTSLIGDIAIAKGAEGIPLYNFAVVVDDAEMRITHVLRGEDHISNIPKQWIIAEALGLPHPVYGHFPMILGPDRSKLSKRHGATSIAEYRELGYLPEALVNFMALLGWHPSDDREIFSLEELVREFSLERVQKAGAIFNISKLDWLNGVYIRKLPIEELSKLLLPYLEGAGYDIRRVGEERLQKIVALERERLKKLSDIVEAADYFFKAPQFSADLLIWKRANREETRQALEAAKKALEALPEKDFNKRALEAALAPLYGKDRGTILWGLRAALSGKRASPGPFEIAEILGKNETLSRLDYALKVL